MRQDFGFIRKGHSESRPGRAAIYLHPEDVTSDSNLTFAEKRAILASWVSDARAIENAPGLRRLDSGAVVGVDAILQALSFLDELAADSGGERKPTSFLARRLRAMSGSLKRMSSRSRPSDDDDDPPPAPAGRGVPYRRPNSPDASGAAAKIELESGASALDSLVCCGA